MTRTGGAAPRFVAALALIVGAAGCTRLEAPPVELSVRDSLLGAGKIVRIANTTNQPLTEVRVEILAPSGESRTYVEPELGAFQTLEVGWKKLGGWQVPAGSEVEVRTQGHWLPFRARLAPEEAEE